VLVQSLGRQWCPLLLQQNNHHYHCMFALQT
jgi:hypothetical protein